MDGVSGAFAVVSLAIQLLESVQKVRRFLHSVQDAPEEVRNLAESLDLLHEQLDQTKLLVEQQDGLTDNLGAASPLNNALANCKIKVERLVAVVDKLQKSLHCNGRLQRKWGALKVYYKKEDITSHKDQVRNAVTMLQSALLINIALTTNRIQQQVHTLDDPTAQLSLPMRPPCNMAATLVAPTLSCHSGVSPTKSCVSLERSSRILYQGFFGSITTREKTKLLAEKGNAKNQRNVIIEKESTSVIIVSFLRRAFEVRLANSLGHISRSLTIYTILPLGAPIFSKCNMGDLEGVQTLLYNEKISPFVQDDNGRTLLHYAMAISQKDLCAFLIGLGVDANRTNFRGRLPWVSPHSNNWPFYRRLSLFPHPLVTLDFSRLIAGALLNASVSKVIEFINGFGGAGECFELLFIQDYAGVATVYQDEVEIWKHILAKAVELFGSGDPSWTNLIRELLRKGHSVHEAPSDCFALKTFARDDIPAWTLLDFLFCSTLTPLEAEEAGNSWLQVLSSEGYDLVSYLEREMALRAPRYHVNHLSSMWGLCFHVSQLIYNNYSRPSISWDWIHDSASLIGSLQTEFKWLVFWPDLEGSMLYCEHLGEDGSNEDKLWPFVYGTYTDLLIYEFYWSCEDCEREAKLKDKRCNRRMRKKADKLLRSRRPKGPRKIPGAWLV